MKTISIAFIMLSSVISVMDDDNNYYGVWSYSAKDVPYEYAEGKIHITEQEETIDIKVKTRHNEYTGKSIKVDENQISFEIFVEGQQVTVTLTITDNELTGIASTVDGQFAISGSKVEE